MTRFKNDEITARLCRIESTFIETDITKNARAELWRRLASRAANSDARRKPKITWLLADSGVGKTTLVETFVEDVNNPRPDADAETQSECRVLYVNLPTPCTIKAMTVEILNGLNDPLSHKHSTTGDNTDRIRTLLSQQDVNLIILDEFQHLIDPERDRVLRASAQWLKRMIDVSQVPVVCVGLPDSERIYTQDRQIQRRTTKIIRMRSFQKDELQLFRGFIHLYEQELGFAEASNLGKKATAAAILSVTDGLIGQVTQLIVEAAEISMRRDSGPDAITVNDLADAFDQLPFEGKNPFAANHRENTAKSVEPALNGHVRSAHRRSDDRHA